MRLHAPAAASSRGDLLPSGRTVTDPEEAHEGDPGPLVAGARPGRSRALYAVVSTERTSSYEKIPLPELMEELGKRVSNPHRYEEIPVKGFAVPTGVAQPQRTDLEHQHSGEQRVRWIDVRLAPVM